eukprot:1206331-Pyramimonas_sp.AAC.1
MPIIAIVAPRVPKQLRIGGARLAALGIVDAVGQRDRFAVAARPNASADDGVSAAAPSAATSATTAPR